MGQKNSMVKSISLVGVEADEDRIELSLQKGKDISELIATGCEKLAYVLVGGYAVAISASACADGSGYAAPAAVYSIPRKRRMWRRKRRWCGSFCFRCLPTECHVYKKLVNNAYRSTSWSSLIFIYRAHLLQLLICQIS